MEGTRNRAGAVGPRHIACHDHSTLSGGTVKVIGPTAHGTPGPAPSSPIGQCCSDTSRTKGAAGPGPPVSEGFGVSTLFLTVSRNPLPVAFKWLVQVESTATFFFFFFF